MFSFLKFNFEQIYNKKVVKNQENLATDIFNIVCNQIIEDIANVNINFVKFRDSLYEIFIYNLDVSECFFYIFDTTYMFFVTV